MAAGPNNVRVVASGFKTAKALYVRVGGSWKQVKNGYVVNSGWKHSYTRSDKQTKTFIFDWSKSYRISGTRYSSSMLDRKNKLVYYGFHKAGSHGIDRVEGAMIGWKDGGMKVVEFLLDKSRVEKVEVRLFGTHNYYGSPVHCIVGFHNQLTAPASNNDGWGGSGLSIDEQIAIDYPKSKTRISTSWTGAAAQRVGDKLRSGSFRGIAVTGKPGSSAGQWGFGGGALYRANRIASGIPSSYYNTDASSRLEIVITADY